jgi:peptidylprolyl isomerase
MSGKQIRCTHLLIKFSGSRNPVSRRTNQSTANVSSEAAQKELQQWLDRIKSGELSFEEAARQRSDCGSYAQGGDLGTFTFETMQKQFSSAAFALAVNEVSGLVLSDSGWHIIKRLA